jgi:hypothetical protein
MPLGATPTDIFTSPKAYGGRSFTIPIPKEAVSQPQGTIGMTREEAFQWPGVDTEFDEAASHAYAELGSPELTSASAWGIFKAMAPLVFRV